jgi:putative cell wall-binding protein/spore germination protein YaaH
MKLALTTLASLLIVAPMLAHAAPAESTIPSHRTQLDLELREADYSDDVVGASSTKEPSSIVETRVAPGTTIMGFHPYWMNGSEASYRWSTMTHLAYFKIEVNWNGDLITNNPNYNPPASLISTAHANGVKVVLAVTAVDTSAQNTQLLLSPTYYNHAADVIVQKVLDSGADGVNIDFELVSSNNRDRFTDFVKVLNSKMKAVNPAAHVSVDLPAIDWNNSYDVKNIAANVDDVILMAYDYWWSGSNTAGPSAPLFDTGWRSNYSAYASIQNYGSQMDRSKLLLGVPWYGLKWNTSGPGVPTNTTNNGIYKYYSQIEEEAVNYGKLWYADSHVPYISGVQSGKQFQTWYDDASSLSAKYNVAKQEQLGGVAIWALGYEGGRSEIWDGLQSYATPSNDTLERLEGSTRYDTAIKISQDLYPTADSASAVVLGTGTNWPDSLGGSVLARAANAPLLLTNPSDITPQVASEIDRVLPAGGMVYLLGGTSALSNEVENDLRGLGFNISRVAGNNRRETAAAIATVMGGQPNAIMLATSQNFADALSLASPAAQQRRPILLTESNQLSQQVTDFLNGSIGSGITTVFIAGGASAVSVEVEAALSQRGLQVIRLAGSTRYDTSAAIARWFYGAVPSVSIASGLGFADGLSGGPHAAANSAPLLLVKNNDLPKPIWDYLQEFAGSIGTGHIYGGMSAVNRAVQDVAQTLIAP